MTASTASAAQDALCTLLAADATITADPKVWCDVAPVTMRPRMVYVDGAIKSRLARMTATPNAAPLSEDFDLTIRVWVDEAGSYRTMRDAAETYAYAAVNVVRNNPQFGGVFLATVTGFERDYGLDDTGQKWQFGVTITVTCSSYNN